MTKCPHCGKIANPLLFLPYSKWHPYRCSVCKKKSRFNRAAMICVVIVGMVGGYFSKSLSAQNGLAGFGVYVGAAIVLMTLTIWVFLPLHPDEVEPNKAAEPTRTTVTFPADAGDRVSGTRGSP
jgi:uncharacterized protein (DUF983 family)